MSIVDQRADRPRAAHLSTRTASHLRRTSASSALVAFLFLLAGCIGGPPAAPAPSWQSMPLSWDKLEKVEQWLRGEGLRADANQRLEAELVLAEGRLAFAEEDRANNPGAPVEYRLDAAIEGFRHVLASNDASATYRNRANYGLERAQGLRDGRAKVQEAANVGGLAIVPRENWNPTRERTNDMDAASGRWNTLTVHHTAMPGAPGPGESEARSAEHIRLVQRAHMNSPNNWADIGYHFLIDPEGRIFEGRKLRWVGAHSGRNDATGQNFNLDNIGISMIGNFESRLPTPKALGSLQRLLDSFRSTYGIASSRVRGHREWKATECPGDALMGWVERYRGFAQQSPATPSRSSSRSNSGAKGKISSLFGHPTTERGWSGDTSAGSTTAR